MPIWEITPDPDTYDCLNPADMSDMNHIAFDGNRFGDRRLKEIWTPLAVAVEQRKRAGDFPSLAGGPPIFSERALHVLFPPIQHSIQVLPLRCDSQTLYAINVIEVVDCLDHARSQFKRFSDGGIMRVEKYAFKEGCVEGKHIFRIPELRVFVFVSDSFKQVVENNRLEGLRFLPTE